MKTFGEHSLLTAEIERLRSEVAQWKASALEREAICSKIEAILPQMEYEVEQLSATVGIEPKSEQELFEEWARPDSVQRRTDAEGNYTERGMSAAFSGWMARSKLPAAQLASVARERDAWRGAHARAIAEIHGNIRSQLSAANARIAELEAIAHSDDGAGGEGMKLYLENRKMKAELAEYRKDVERYRWLRLALPCDEASAVFNSHVLEELDAAIDDAMKEAS